MLPKVKLRYFFDSKYRLTSNFPCTLKRTTSSPKFKKVWLNAPSKPSVSNLMRNIHKKKMLIAVICIPLLVICNELLEALKIKSKSKRIRNKVF